MVCGSPVADVDRDRQKKHHRAGEAAAPGEDGGGNVVAGRMGEQSGDTAHDPGDEQHANVSVLVVLDGAPNALPLLHGFTLIDDQLVIVDLYNTGLISRRPRDVGSYRRAFGALEEQAIDIRPTLDRYEDQYKDQYVQMLQQERPPPDPGRP
jgi:hypothetical protein